MSVGVGMLGRAGGGGVPVGWVGIVGESKANCVGRRRLGTESDGRRRDEHDS